MPKKKISKTKNNSRKKEKIAKLTTLPQNIKPMGEHVEENKNIYISQKAYKEIQKFTKNKLTNESGGMLIGGVIEAFGKTNIIIQGFIEAKYSEGTPTTLKFTHETWDYVHAQMEEKYDNGQIVGWIHTHPDFGIFLSEYDKFIQENFFKEEYQVAYVVDPIQHIEGFYFWINERIEKCKGFYIYDETGVPIEIDTKENEEPEADKFAGIWPKITVGLAAALLFVVVLFSIICLNLSHKIDRLESQRAKDIDAICRMHIGDYAIGIDPSGRLSPVPIPSQPAEGEQVEGQPLDGQQTDGQQTDSQKSEETSGKTNQESSNE